MARARTESFSRVQLQGRQLLIGIPRCIVQEAGVVRRAPYLVRHTGGGCIVLVPLDREGNARLRRV
jgi:hypothetical protein